MPGRWALSYEDPLSFDKTGVDEMRLKSRHTALSMGAVFRHNSREVICARAPTRNDGALSTMIHIPAHPMVQPSTIHWEPIESQGQSLPRHHCRATDDPCWLPSALARSTLPMRTWRVPGQQEGSGGKWQSNGGTIEKEAG